MCLGRFLRLGSQLHLLAGVLRFLALLFQVCLQLSNLVLQLSSAVYRRLWTGERSKFDLLSLAKAALKPHRQLARQFQHLNGIANIACKRVVGVVASSSDVVEDINQLSAQCTALFEVTNELNLWRLFIRINTKRSGRPLGQAFRKLAQLQNSRVRVVMHVPFGQARQPHEQGIVLSQKGKIWASDTHRDRSDL